MRRAQQQLVTFAAIDSASPPARKSGLVLLGSDVKLSKDGAAYVSATNAPAEIGSTGRYSLVLTAAETNCSWLSVYIEKTGMQPNDDLTGGMDGQRTAAVAGTGQTTTSFVTTLTEGVDSVHVGKLVRFQTGACAGQVRKITGYNGTTKALTFTDAFTTAPSAADVFALIDD
jgi:hypothetical protein